jgi:hypothetical protein
MWPAGTAVYTFDGQAKNLSVLGSVGVVANVTNDYEMVTGCGIGLRH